MEINYDIRIPLYIIRAGLDHVVQCNQACIVYIYMYVGNVAIATYTTLTWALTSA